MAIVGVKPDDGRRVLVYGSAEFAVHLAAFGLCFEGGLCAAGEGHAHLAVKGSNGCVLLVTNVHSRSKALLKTG